MQQLKWCYWSEKLLNAPQSFTKSMYTDWLSTPTPQRTQTHTQLRGNGVMPRRCFTCKYCILLVLVNLDVSYVNVIHLHLLRLLMCLDCFWYFTLSFCFHTFPFVSFPSFCAFCSLSPFLYHFANVLFLFQLTMFIFPLNPTNHYFYVII